MEHGELLIHLAGISGVFVGFGALISIRGEGTRDAYEIALIRMIVWFGIMVVVVALTPVVIAGFDVDGHGLWVASALVFLVLWWGGTAVMERLNPERTRYLASISPSRRIRIELPSVPLWLAMHVALALILLGLLPDHEAALYVVAVTLLLLIDAMLLLLLVYQQGRPRPGGFDESPSDLEAPTAEQIEDSPTTG